MSRNPSRTVTRPASSGPSSCSATAASAPRSCPPISRCSVGRRRSASTRSPSPLSARSCPNISVTGASASIPSAAREASRSASPPVRASPPYSPCAITTVRARTAPGSASRSACVWTIVRALRRPVTRVISRRRRSARPALDTPCAVCTTGAPASRRQASARSPISGISQPWVWTMSARRARRISARQREQEAQAVDEAGRAAPAQRAPEPRVVAQVVEDRCTIDPGGSTGKVVRSARRERHRPALRRERAGRAHRCSRRRLRVRPARSSAGAWRVLAHPPRARSAAARHEACACASPAMRSPRRAGRSISSATTGAAYVRSA